jgi:hypothetical protein
MRVNHFKRLSRGKYKDTVTGALILRDGNSWVICIEDFRLCAFVTGQWGDPLATYRISGFSTMKEARMYDFFSLFRKTGRPYRNRQGTTVSVPVGGFGRVPVVSSFSVSDLAIEQGLLF